MGLILPGHCGSLLPSLRLFLSIWERIMLLPSKWESGRHGFTFTMWIHSKAMAGFLTSNQCVYVPLEKFKLLPYSDYDMKTHVHVNTLPQIWSELESMYTPYSEDDWRTRVRMHHSPRASLCPPRTKTMKTPAPLRRGASMSLCITEDATENIFFFSVGKKRVRNDTVPCMTRKFVHK